MNEFNEYVREVFSAAGDIVIKSMMGGYLVYLNGKLIGDICGNELFLKRTPTSLRRRSSCSSPKLTDSRNASRKSQKASNGTYGTFAVCI